MSEIAASITDHRDRVAAEPRPVRVASRPEADASGTIRLYKPEWVIVHTERGDTPSTAVTAAREHFARTYAGRVRDTDVDYHTGHEPQAAQPFVVQLRLCLPVLKGEFKYRSRACAWAAKHGIDDYWTVQRNSPADHELRAYGTKKLADA